MARTRAPPAIFRSTTFSAFTDPLQQQQQLVDLAYKHPRLLIDDDDDHVDNGASADDVVNEVTPTKLAHCDNRSNDDGNCNKIQKEIVDSIRSNGTFASNSFSNLNLSHLNRQFDENCKLIGKVNPNLVKTWEQLNGNRIDANEHIAYPMDNEVVSSTVDAIATLTKNNGRSFVIYHTAENSGHYYDSIDNDSVITRTEDDLDEEIVVSSIDEMAVTAGGEAMADFLSIVSNDRKFCWSVDSNNQ